MLELGGPRGQYCGKLLADLGADVLKIEPPQGDPARSLGPFAGDEPHPERSLYFLYFNSNKRSVVLDLETEEGRQRLIELVRTADALIDGFPPGHLAGLGLGYETLRGVNPGLVMTSITGFGQTGPYRDYKATDLIGFAMGGLLYMSGDPAAAPVVAPCEQAHQLAGAHAAYATLLALYNRGATARGTHRDVSVQEAVASVYFTIVRYGMKAEIVERVGSSVPARWCGIYPTQDGYASVYIGPPAHFRAFVGWAGHPQELQDPQWQERDYRAANYRIMDRHIQEVTRVRTKAQVTREGQERHITVGPVNNVAEFVESEHARARGFFVEQEHPLLGRVPFPGPAYRLSASPWRIRRPAPLLGQHTQEVLAEGRGLATAAPRKGPAQTGGRIPFEGVRILDFTRVWAGPFATRYLGDLGVEVIRIETSKNPDMRPSGPGVDPQRRYEQDCLFAEVNRSKLGITVDLSDPRGRELVRRLVAICDVVTENFSPRVMARWGLEYPELRRLRPDLIMVSQPGFGRSGPLRDYVAYGATITAYTGMASLWCHPGAPGEVWCQLSYPDFIAAAHAALAVVSALHFRERTGRGQHIELAMVDAAAATMGVAYLDYLVNGRIWQPQGNHSPHWAPHNVYRCRGQDEWCAIAVTSEEEWQRFCQVLGHPTWTKDPRFSTKEGRLQSQEELDRRIEEWTMSYTPHQVMHLLQRAGVPAGAVQSGEDLFYDHHLRQRGFITQVEYPGAGLVSHAGIVVKAADRPRTVQRRAPTLGEHNQYVFGELLGLSSRTIQELEEAKVLA